MNDNDIRKCKKNGYCWASPGYYPHKINITGKSAVLSILSKDWLHPTRAAAQAAIDERNRLASLAEYRKSMEPITPEQAKDLRDGDEFFYLQAGSGAPRYHVTRDKLDRRPDITKWKCFTEGRAYWTREAAEAALAKRKTVESHKTPVGKTQPKEVVTDETQTPKPTTVRGWLETIPDPAIREAAIRQCIKLTEACDSLNEAIIAKVDWASTDEGVDFWKECFIAARNNTTWPSYPPKAKQEADVFSDYEIKKAAFDKSLKWIERKVGDIIQMGDEVTDWKNGERIIAGKSIAGLPVNPEMTARYVNPLWLALQEIHDMNNPKLCFKKIPLLPREWTDMPQHVASRDPGSKYHRTIHGVSEGTATVDVYNVLEAFGVTCPACQHAIKKLLCAGLRGKGSRLQDLTEAATSIARAIELEKQRGEEA